MSVGSLKGICYICQNALTNEKDKNGVPVCKKCQDEHGIKAEDKEEFNMPPLFTPAKKMPSITPVPENPFDFSPLEIDESDLGEFDDDPTPVLGPVNGKQKCKS